MWCFYKQWKDKLQLSFYSKLSYLANAFLLLYYIIYIKPEQ